MDFTEGHPGVASEIILALCKELKVARNRIRDLEPVSAASSNTSGGVEPRTSGSLGVAASNALPNPRARELEQERDAAVEQAWKLSLRVTNLQNEMDSVKRVKREAAEDSIDTICDLKTVTASRTLFLQNNEVLAQKNKELEKQLAMNKDEVAMIQRLADDLKARDARSVKVNAAQQEEIRRLRALLDHPCKKIHLDDEYKTRTDRLQTEVEELKRAHSGLQSAVNKKEATRRKLEETLKDAQNEIERLKRLLATATQLPRISDDEQKELPALRRGAADSQRETAIQKDVLAQLEERSEAWRLDVYRKRFSSLAKDVRPPNSRSDVPLCSVARVRELLARLEQDTRTKGNYSLFLPGGVSRVLRLDPKSNHALALGSAYRYDLDGNQWLASSEFSNVYGKAVQLILHNSESVYYAGLFRCHDVCADNPLGCAEWRITPSTSKFLARSAVISSTKEASLKIKAADYDHTHHTYHEGTKERATVDAIEQLYSGGVLKVEAMVLEYIGFNVALHSDLSGHMTQETSVQTRKAHKERSGRPAKKSKVSVEGIGDY
ncbi:hypothetical protein FA15DRAFT_670393 [Coprinopsis marcescibilis]|uniref:Uncharacterized protein n=1 Tax=Coprinopsis marcescibilis TaxID=230819 RepID=A0A5C3KSS3_COPMA|nr:hypothetical protein FA15DRAFT_670393 [Coprinopsis marcescibilis]